MDKLKKGQLVRIAPQWMDTPDEAKALYRVVEDNGDRLIAELVCELPIPPQELLRREMVVLVEGDSVGGEFYVECYLQGTAGAVKLAELACDRSNDARAKLAETLAATYRPEDVGKIELRARGVTANDASGVAQGLVGELSVAWRVACAAVLQ